jgi:hypothetical protein
MKAYAIKRYGKNVEFEVAELQQPAVGEQMYWLKSMRQSLMF